MSVKGKTQTTAVNNNTSTPQGEVQGDLGDDDEDSAAYDEGCYPAFQGVKNGFASNGKAILMWDAATWDRTLGTCANIKYNVYVKMSDGSLRAVAEDVTTLNTAVTGLPAGRTYTFVVKMKIGDVVYNNTTERSVRIPDDDSLPDFDGVSSVQFVYPGQFVVTWGSIDDSDVTVNMYYSTTSGGQNFGTPDDTTTYDQTGKTVSFTCTAGATYYFVVRVEKNETEDTNTTEAGAICGGGAPMFSGVSSLSVTGADTYGDIVDESCGNSNTSMNPTVVLGWDNSNAGTPGGNVNYLIYRSVNAEQFNFNNVYAVTGNNTFADACGNLNAGSVFYYTVRSCDEISSQCENNNAYARGGYAKYMKFIDAGDAGYLHKRLFEGVNDNSLINTNRYVRDFFIDTYEAGCKAASYVSGTQICNSGTHVAANYSNLPGESPYVKIGLDDANTVCTGVYSGGKAKRLPTNYEFFLASQWVNENANPNDSLVATFGATLDDTEIGMLEGNGNNLYCNTKFGEDGDGTNDSTTGTDAVPVGSNAGGVEGDQAVTSTDLCRSYYGVRDMVGNVEEWVYGWTVAAVGQNNNIDDVMSWTLGGISFDGTTYPDDDVGPITKYDFSKAVPAIASAGTAVESHNDSYFWGWDGGFVRGGYYTNTTDNGIYYLKNITKTTEQSYIGFRCMLAPY